jgi:hypothetical protein
MIKLIDILLLEETMSAEETVDYVKSKTPSDSDHPDLFISAVLKSGEEFELKQVKISDLLKADENLRNYVESGEVRYGQGGESDLTPIEGEEYAPIVVFRDKVIDGYSRIATLYNRGERTIRAWVSKSGK